LEREYWSESKAMPPISVVDATLRAAFRIGRHGANGYGEFVRPSLLIEAAWERYHRRDYEGALEYLERAESMGGRSTQLLEVKIRSLAQLKKLSAARDALRAYRESGERRQWYLAGFIERKANNHPRACERFQRGYAQGDRSVSLLRDYADSLLRTEAIDAASEIAAEALEREPGNVYLRDLAARIAIWHEPSDVAVEAALEALEAADIDQRFILTRKASYLLHRKGNAEANKQAVVLAENATKKPDASLDAYFVLAYGLIRLREWGRLKEVRADIEKVQRIGRDRSLLNRLDFEATIEKGEWRRAERLLPKALQTKEDQRMRLAVVRLKEQDHTVLLEERQAMKREIAVAEVDPTLMARRGPLQLGDYE
jgi:predicted Zn-dependent protease